LTYPRLRLIADRSRGAPSRNAFSLSATLTESAHTLTPTLVFIFSTLVLSLFSFSFPFVYCRFRLVLAFTGKLGRILPSICSVWFSPTLRFHRFEPSCTLVVKSSAQSWCGIEGVIHAPMPETAPIPIPIPATVHISISLSLSLPATATTESTSPRPNLAVPRAISVQQEAPVFGPLGCHH